MLLRDIMKRNVVTLSPETSIREAARAMKRFSIGYLLVTNGQAIKGCLTDRDIAVWLAEGHDPDNTRIDTLMNREVVWASPDTDVFDASRIMARKKVRRLPIVEDNRIVGLITTSDLASVIEEEVDNFFHVEEAYQH